MRLRRRLFVAALIVALLALAAVGLVLNAGRRMQHTTT
jgi:hypothetical protein